MAADEPRDVLPIELLNSFDLLANARVEYVDAIVDYNRAQFAMYVALGQPPANSLAHPVPVQGVVAGEPATAVDARAFSAGEAARRSRERLERIARDCEERHQPGFGLEFSDALRAALVKRMIPPPRDGSTFAVGLAH